MTRALAVVLALLAVPALAGEAKPRRAGKDARARVALTFDDLPAHGALPPGRTRVAVLRDVVEALRDAQAPDVYGFVNAGPVGAHPDLADALRAWRDGGFPLGNHAFSHVDLNKVTPAEFEKDVLANETTLKDLSGPLDWRWFRFPFLHEGDTPEKRRAVRELLEGHRYRVAQVTISFNDWAYHDPYARCAAKGDRESLAWLKESYLARADASLAEAQDASRRMFGRDIAHVMLLHVGAFNEVVLRPLLDLLRRRGFSLVTLEDAQRDPVYAEVPDLASADGITMLERYRRARGLDAPGRSESPFEKLSALCR